MSRLCAACQPKWLAWLDYRLVLPIRIHAIGEDNMRAMRDGRTARFEQWRDTITFQQNLIAETCTSRHAPAAPRRLPVEQLHLFDLPQERAA